MTVRGVLLRGRAMLVGAQLARKFFVASGFVVASQYHGMYVIESELSEMLREAFEEGAKWATAGKGKKI